MRRAHSPSSRFADARHDLIWRSVGSMSSTCTSLFTLAAHTPQKRQAVNGLNHTDTLRPAVGGWLERFVGTEHPRP